MKNSKRAKELESLPCGEVDLWVHARVVKEAKAWLQGLDESRASSGRASARGRLEAWRRSHGSGQPHPKSEGVVCKPPDDILVVGLKHSHFKHALTTNLAMKCRGSASQPQDTHVAQTRELEV